MFKRNIEELAKNFHKMQKKCLEFDKEKYLEVSIRNIGHLQYFLVNLQKKYLDIDKRNT